MNNADSDAGTYTARFTVTDALGVHLATTATVRANGLPTIGDFAVTPSTVVYGENVTFWLNVSGGTGALVASYSGAPPGCAGLGLAGGVCTSSSTGIFEVHVAPTDAEGRGSNATTNLTVAASPTAATVGWTVPEELSLLGIGAVLLVACAVLVGRRREKRKDHPPPEPSEPTPVPPG